MNIKAINIISIRAALSIQSPYRRIIQKEMSRIAPIIPIVKGEEKKGTVAQQESI